MAYAVNLSGGNNKTVERPPLWTPGCSQLVMISAGLVAWTTAIGLAVNNKAASIAVTFTLAGMLLIAGAALYDRIRWFGTKGIGVAPVDRAVHSFVDRLPAPSPRIPQERERARFAEALRYLTAEIEDEIRGGGTFSARKLESTVDKAVDSYQAGIRMEAGARELLESQGFTVESDVLGTGVDLYARRGDLTRPVSILSRKDLDDVYRRRGVLSRLGEASDVSPIVVTDVKPASRLREELISDGIEIVQLDPASGDLQAVYEPPGDV